MIKRTALALAITATSTASMASTIQSVQRLASLEPVMVENRGSLTIIPVSASVSTLPAVSSVPTATPAAPAATPSVTATATADASITTTAVTAGSTPIPTPAPAPTAAVIPETLPAATPLPGTGRGSDAVWRKIMLGTWQAVDDPQATAINGEATFTPDGRAVGYTTATYVYQDGATSDVKVSMNFRWRIEQGVVILDQFESDPPGFIKKTLVRRFEIKSMNDTGAVFKDLDDGQEVYRRRKPD